MGGREAWPRGVGHARPLRQQAEGLLVHHRGGNAERGSRTWADIRGTGPDGPFEIRGLDRVRTRDGIVVENVIRYEPVVVTQR